MSDASTPNPNPYSAPSSLEPTIEGVAPPGRPADFRTARSLANWQLFFAILCFLAFGLIVLYIGVVLVFVGGWNTRGLLSLSILIGICMTGMFTLVYLVVGLLFVRGSSAAKRFSNTPDRATLVAMMESQVWLWRTIGGITLVGMGLWLVGMLLAMLVG